MPTALLHDLLADGSSRWLSFDRPRRLLVAHRLDQVAEVLDAVADEAAAGRWAVGYLAYDAAPAIDPLLIAAQSPSDGPPLAWWAIFDRPSTTGERLNPPRAAWPPLDWRPSIEATEHRRRVEAIRSHIAAGDTYQANLTFPLTARWAPTIDELAFFARLQAAQRAAHAAYLDLGNHAIVSVSPELFFDQHDDLLRARPMKGTARRGRFPAEDAEYRAELRTAKNRAENLMIVDMLRNDLGRVARPGTVRVDQLFAEETYPTVHQLVSSVRARTAVDPVTTLRALFPCASITGAPKRRTMEILAELEGQPRGLYTGAIGRIGPGRSARLAVAIRTVTVDRRQQRATYGVGGGIVWDSTPDAEWHECRTKARVLARQPPRFELLETMRWQPHGGYFLLERHLARLDASARHFDFPCDLASVRAALRDAASKFPRQAGIRQRVRLRLDAEGKVLVDAQPMTRTPRQVWRIAVDDRPVDLNDPLLFHKTTHRILYDEAAARHPDADETLLINTEGYLTEGCRTNLVVRFGSRFVTPPVTAGLLAGIYRGLLIDRGHLEVATVSPHDLISADAIYCLNTLRGPIRAELMDTSVPLITAASA